MKKHIFLAYILVLLPVLNASGHRRIVPTITAPIRIIVPDPETDVDAEFFCIKYQFAKIEAESLAAQEKLTAFLEWLGLETIFDESDLTLGKHARGELYTTLHLMSLKYLLVEPAEAEQLVKMLSLLAKTYNRAVKRELTFSQEYLLWDPSKGEDYQWDLRREKRAEAWRKRRKNLSEAYTQKAREKWLRRESMRR